MRQIVLMYFIVAQVAVCSAQKFEYSFQAGSGFFSFGGNSSVSNSYIIVSDAGPSSYTNNPYGKRNGLSYGFSARMQRITKTNKIFGLQAGYELLSSKVIINSIYRGLVYPSSIPASGKTNLNNEFFNLFPFIGQRFAVNIVNIDLTLGADFGICKRSLEEGKAFADSYEYRTYLERKKPTVDFRPRIEIAGYLRQIGFTIGYSYGLTNYTAGMAGANMETYSRILRFGVIYRL